MPKYRCVVAIPTRELFSGEIDYANIPGSIGYMGVLSNHENFVGLNRTGKLTPRSRPSRPTSQRLKLRKAASSRTLSSRPPCRP